MRISELGKKEVFISNRYLVQDNCVHANPEVSVRAPPTSEAFSLLMNPEQCREHQRFPVEA